MSCDLCRAGSGSLTVFCKQGGDHTVEALGEAYELSGLSTICGKTEAALWDFSTRSERAGEVMSEEDMFIVEACSTLYSLERKLMERATKLAEAAGAAAAEMPWEAAAERAEKRQRHSPEPESA